MRIPFPIKVFVSYLAVLAAGALPTYIYIESSFVGELANARAQETANRVSMIVEELRPLDREARVGRAKELAKSQLERFTYIGATGVVLYDSSSDASSLDNHASRPEVLKALDRPVQDDDSLLEVTGTDVGAARRVSLTTGLLSIYVAARLDERGEVVRLALPGEAVTTLADRLRLVFRNSQAAALSVALLLSVLAAFVFMRPLQRLARSSHELAAGDYTASRNWRGDDEIGDVGIALNKLALELRQRLANAQAAETLIIQAAEFVAVPMALIEPGGKVLLINGAFRRAIEDPTTDAEDVLARLLGSKKYSRAVDRCRVEGNSEVLHWTQKKVGLVLEMHPLERPASEPLVLLTVHTPETTGLPAATDIRPVALRTLIESAVSRASTRAASCHVTVDYVDASAAQALVADAEQRVELAVAVFVEAAARGQEALRLCVSDDTLGVHVWLDGEPSAAPLRLVRLLLEPLGGSVAIGDTITLNLPRA